MNNDEKLSVVDRILENVADQLGDISPLVLDRFHRDHPEAKALFSHHGGSRTTQLENDMVESAVYCLMIWFESPAEIEVMFSNTVPHHELLKIPAELFSSLLETTHNVIEKTIPERDQPSQRVWAELKRTLVELAKASSLESLNLAY